MSDDWLDRPIANDPPAEPPAPAVADVNGLDPEFVDPAMPLMGRWADWKAAKLDDGHTRFIRIDRDRWEGAREIPCVDDATLQRSIGAMEAWNRDVGKKKYPTVAAGGVGRKDKATR